MCLDNLDKLESEHDSIIEAEMDPDFPDLGDSSDDEVEERERRVVKQTLLSKSDSAKRTPKGSRKGRWKSRKIRSSRNPVAGEISRSSVSEKSRSTTTRSRSCGTLLRSRRCPLV